MSKPAAILIATVGTASRMKRTIDHSPAFAGPEADARDGRPATRIPPGGFLTG